MKTNSVESLSREVGKLREQLQAAFRKVAELENALAQSKKAEAERQEEANHFRLIVQSAKELAIIVLDLEGNVTGWYGGARQLFGYEPEETIGRHMRFLFTEKDNERRLSESELELALRSGHSLNDHWNVRKDGTVFWASGLLTPMRQEDGSMVGVLKIMRDRTESRLAEENLKRSQEQLELATGSAGVGTWELDLVTGKGHRSNECLQLWESKVAECNKDNWTNVILEDDRHRALEAWTRAVEDDARYEVECRSQAAWSDGREKWLLIRGRIERTPQGAPVRGAGVVLDITERKRAEDALASQRSREQAYLEHLPIGVWFIDQSGQIEFGNRAAQEIWQGARYVGIERFHEYRAWRHDTGELIGKHDWAAARAVREGRPTMNEELDIECFDGSRKTILNSAVPVRNGEGEIVGAVVLNQDISDKKLSEQRLADAHRFLNNTLDALSSHIAVLDENGQIIAVNDAWRHFAIANGMTSENFGIGYNYLDACNPDDECFDNTMVEGIQHVLSGKRDYYELEYPCPTETETLWYVMRATRFKSANPVRVVISHDNITARKLAEEGLRTSESRFRQLADSMPQVVWVALSSGEVVYYNTRVKGFSGVQQQSNGMWDWRPAVHPDDLELTTVTWQNALKGDGSYQLEHRLGMADGTYRWHLSRAYRVSVYGKDDLWFGTATDIQELKAAQEALRDVDRRKDEFLATLAHELRNPLAPLRNGLQIMELAKDDPATVDQCRGMMERQLAQMVRLIDDLMDVSRITRGKIELRCERTELASVLQQAIETSRPLIHEKKHHLILDIGPTSLQINADAARLGQVFANLLNNAAKYSEPNGQISVTARQEGTHAIVRIRDQGIGIPRGMLPQIFEMFTQVDRSLEKSHGGLGIGLSLAKGLVEMHGGTIEATSDGPGTGSEFCVRLPIAHKDLESNQSGPASSPPPLPHRKILVVDDNRDAAQSMAMMLKLLGLECRIAHDGFAALDVADGFQPDIVLLDIGMPKMNGYETARRMREQAWADKLILIALTGWGQEDDIRRAKESGFDLHLTKPVSPKFLRTVLADLHRDSGASPRS